MEYEKRGVEVRLRQFAIGLKNPSVFPFLPSSSSPSSSTKFIIHPLTTTIPGSSLFAIMGGSGSGKTTLLNVLAGRFDESSYHIEGDVQVGKDACSIGYVTQMDFLLPHLTVRETLMFTARLKIAATKVRELLHESSAHDDTSSTQNMTLKECYEHVVQDVIMALGL